MLKMINNIFSKKKNDEKIKTENAQELIFQTPTFEPDSHVVPKNSDQTFFGILKAGNDSLANSNFDDAEKFYRKAIEINSVHLGARINLAWVLSVQKTATTENLEEAKLHLLKALEINESHIDVNYILAQIYERLNDIDNSLKHYMDIIKLNPNWRVARDSLYNLAFKSKKIQVVTDFIEKELIDHHENTELYFDLGNFYKESENYSKSIENYEIFLKHNEKSSQAHNNLGAVYLKLLKPEVSMIHYKKAIEYGNLDLQIDSSNQLLMTMNYLSDCSLSDYYEEVKKYGSLLNEKYKDKQFDSWKQNEDKLKIGFVSGDIKQHPMSYFLINIFKNFNKKDYEFIVYSTSTREDSVSSHIRKFISKWTRINILDPIECARQIQEEGIDILIDLSGHSHTNFAKNLHIFAMKPAPVQATWLGYSNSTGVEQIDYNILDSHCIKEEENQYITEKVIDMPESRFNYCPPEENVIYPTITPFVKKDFITFGCYQDLLKINNEVLNSWKEILNQVPNSVIRIQNKKINSEISKNNFVEILKLYGMHERVILEGEMAFKDYLNSYSQVDIILDTFPWSGSITTCESLWMGVPVLTLNGNNIIGRQTTSILEELNMSEWIAETKDNYIEKAVKLSSDINYLNKMRGDLREKFLKSSICDARNFTLDFEELLEEIWENKPTRI